MVIDGGEWSEVPVEEFLHWKTLSYESQIAAGYALVSQQGWVLRNVTFNQVCLSPFVGGGNGMVMKPAIKSQLRISAVDS